MRDEKRRCRPCYGSGKLLGSGMVQENCYHCDGTGFVSTPPEDDEINYLLNKSNEHYQTARANIQNLSPGMSEEKAEAILDAALCVDGSANDDLPLTEEQLLNEDQPKKRGRPKKDK